MVAADHLDIPLLHGLAGVVPLRPGGHVVHEEEAAVLPGAAGRGASWVPPLVLGMVGRQRTAQEEGGVGQDGDADHFLGGAGCWKNRQLVKAGYLRLATGKSACQKFY